MSLRTLHRRDVPLDWERRLADFSPPTTRFTWLKLLWEPGYAWEEPVERFLIYQMTPEHAVPEGVLEQLADYPPPSKMGNYYDSVLDTFVRDPDCLITERAWHLFQETRCWGRPFWVIQGPNGGHKRWFSNVEKQFMKLANLPADPPEPGDLPYAEFDESVIAQLMRHDRLQNIQAGLKRKRDLLKGVADDRYADQEKQFRVEIVKWLADQVTEVGEGVMESLMALDAPRSASDPKDMERQEEWATQNFIETGRTHSGLYLAR